MALGRDLLISPHHYAERAAHDIARWWSTGASDADTRFAGGCIATLESLRECLSGNTWALLRALGDLPSSPFPTSWAMAVSGLPEFDAVSALSELVNLHILSIAHDGDGGRLLALQGHEARLARLSPRDVVARTPMV